MNRELAEVRRYWPRATARTSDELDRGQVGWREYAAGRASIRVDGDGAVVSRPLAFIWPVPPSPTIAAAMRAAGFGVRPLGRFAAARAAVSNHHRTFGFGGMSNEAYSHQKFARQRPRKGARLGRRKKEAKP